MYGVLDSPTPAVALALAITRCLRLSIRSLAFAALRLVSKSVPSSMPEFWGLLARLVFVSLIACPHCWPK